MVQEHPSFTPPRTNRAAGAPTGIDGASSSSESRCHRVFPGNEMERERGVAQRGSASPVFTRGERPTIESIRASS